MSQKNEEGGGDTVKKYQIVIEGNMFSLWTVWSQTFEEVPDGQVKNMYMRTEHKTGTKRKWCPHIKRKKEEKIKKTQSDFFIFGVTFLNT